MSYFDEQGHDDECEWASEACGCDSRSRLRARISELGEGLRKLTREAASLRLSHPHLASYYYISEETWLEIRRLLGMEVDGE